MQTRLRQHWTFDSDYSITGIKFRRPSAGPRAQDARTRRAKLPIVYGNDPLGACERVRRSGICFAVIRRTAQKITSRSGCPRVHSPLPSLSRCRSRCSTPSLDFRQYLSMVAVFVFVSSIDRFFFTHRYCLYSYSA